MEKKLDFIITELQNLNQRVGGIESETKGLKNEMKSVKTEMNSMKTEMKSMKTEMNSVNTEMNSMKTEMKSVKTQLDENTLLTRAIYDRQEETDARLESLSYHVNKMHGDIKLIKGEVEFTFEKTNKHELELFMLKREQSESEKI